MRLHLFLGFGVLNEAHHISYTSTTSWDPCLHAAGKSNHKHETAELPLENSEKTTQLITAWSIIIVRRSTRQQQRSPWVADPVISLEYVFNVCNRIFVLFHTTHAPRRGTRLLDLVFHLYFELHGSSFNMSVTYNFATRRAN